MKEKPGSKDGRKKGRPVSYTHIDQEAPQDNTRPKGPFKSLAGGHAGDLLIFVPRNVKSRTIDVLTGRYGYSHLAIDTGQIDQPTGRRVLIESTMDDVVHFSFQDEYGERSYVRIPLEKTGVDVNKFCKCVPGMLGEKFDDVEALTLGILDNPARQICSDLATQCLPEELKKDIARCHRAAVIHPLSAVLHERSGTKVRIFISPNGYAEYFGAPKGYHLTGPDQLAEPHPQNSQESLGLLGKIRKQTEFLLTTGWRFLRYR